MIKTCLVQEINRLFSILGVILPTDSIKIPFSFKSSNAGIFSETWQLETQPMLCGGAPMLVILRGVSTEEDLLAEQRKELEVSLILIRKQVGINKVWGAFLYFRIVSCAYRSARMRPKR